MYRTDGTDENDGPNQERVPVKLDIDTLGTFYELVQDGAGLAARRVAPMTDLRTREAVTHLHFADRDGIVRKIDDSDEKVAVWVELRGGLEGMSLLVFDREVALSVAETLVTDFPREERGEISRSAIVEMSQTTLSGFVDEWADTLETQIDISTPTFITTDDATEILDMPAADDAAIADDELALVFRSRIAAVGSDIDFRHYLIPDRESVTTLLEEWTTGDAGIDHRKLYRFDRMAQEGAVEAAANLTSLTDMEVGVDIRRINFVSLDAIPNAIPTEPQVSVAFSFDGTPSGYLLFLFDEGSAEELIAAAVDDSDGDLDDLGRDTIQELSNIMASGMLDGWANLLDTTINHSAPAYAHDMGAAVVDPLLVGLGDEQSFAFVFDTRIEGIDTVFDTRIYILPDETSLQRGLSRLDVTAEVDSRPSGSEFEMFAETDSDPESFSEIGDPDAEY